jgi:glucokinase
MMETVRDRPVLAIDIGGTKFVAAVVSAAGEIISRQYKLTLADEGPEAVVGRLLETIRDLVRDAASAPSTIAIAAAGAIDSNSGTVTSSPNLPGWHDVPLRETVHKATGMRTILLNDASAAALGEHAFGAGRGVSHLVYITVSTGIGGGIIVDGKLYGGACGAAGEIGHTTIDVNGPHCSCGNVGCLEMLASGKAIAREAQRLISGGARSCILELAEGELQNVTAQTVSAAAQRGDATARAVVAKAAAYLGVGLVNLVNIFNPEMIIVGGGVAKMGDSLLDGARKVVAERAFQLPARAVRIVPSELGDNAGILGAVAFAGAS